MNGDIALQDVAKLFSLMRIVGVCFPAWLQCQKNRLHHVLLCVGNDPFDLIFQFQIVLFKVICLSKDDLLLRSLVKELSDGGPKACLLYTSNHVVSIPFDNRQLELGYLYPMDRGLSDYAKEYLEYFKKRINF